ncbi:MAG: hypothetical protein QOJ73_1603 [Streptosporangiaceae bacterium]|nr:hypothetical protein [Streptosporangiaceae bacterium]
MCHQGIVIRRAVWSGATFALAVVGLLAEATGAFAGTLSSPVTLADENARPATVPVTYSCSLTGSSASMPPVTVNAVLAAPATATVGAAMTVTLTTRPVQLPPASTPLPAFTQVTGTGTAQSTDMSASGLALSGQSGASSQTSGTAGGQTSAGGQTGAVGSTSGQTSASGAAGGSTALIPAIIASGSAIPANAGPATVQAPSTLTLTPVGVAGLAFNCAIAGTSAGPSAAAVQITVTQPAATTGPLYACTITTGAHSVLQTDRIPLMLRGTGPNRVGSTDTVTLSAPGNSFGGPYPAGTSAVSFSGALPVTGAQASSVPLAGNMSAAANDFLAMSGPLPLVAAGMDHILPPARFTVIVHAPQDSVVVCVLKTTVTTTMMASTTVNVTAGTQAPAAPAGAPNTGGGGSLHHASRLPALAAGTAALLAGVWFTVAGLRRRQRHFPA